MNNNIYFFYILKLLFLDGNFDSDMNVERDRLLIVKLENILREDASWKVHVCIDKNNIPVIKATYLPDKFKCKHFNLF